MQFVEKINGEVSTREVEMKTLNQIPCKRDDFNVDHSIITKSNSYGVCEDMQLILDHMITSCVAKIKQHHE